MLRRGGERWELKGTPPRHFFSDPLVVPPLCLPGSGSSVSPGNPRTGPMTRQRAAFSLMEALMAISLMALAGGAIMLALASSAQTTQVTLETSIARGIAAQLLDEVLGQRYAAVGAGPYTYPLGPGAWELSGEGRERYDDTGDYHTFTAQPVTNILGQELGQGSDGGFSRHPNFRLPSGYFSAWREEIEVYYVDAEDHSLRLDPGATSDYRAVEVRILRDHPDGTPQDLARLRRVYAHVPAPQ